MRLPTRDLTGKPFGELVRKVNRGKQPHLSQSETNGSRQSTPVLSRSFYARPPIEVARDLLGCVLIHNERAARIVEVEAYLGRGDPPSHAHRGLTERTKVLFGPPGHAYVYLIYGMYECLNIVTQPEGEPGCVLIRALEPLHGVTQRTDGPGKLTRAMGISRSHYGADLTTSALRVHFGTHHEPATRGPRIGIGLYPDLPLRFWLQGNAFVSRG